jgi:hypothetical protein
VEVEGAGKVTPSPVEVQVASIDNIKEHLHLPSSQALLVVQTKLEFLETSNGWAITAASFYIHKDRHSQIQGQVHS